MSRYIDADKLKEFIDCCHMRQPTELWNYKAFSDCDVVNMIDEQPTADVVEVVRCKDCKYYETCNLRLSHWWKGGYTVDIEFCSLGERAEA